MSALDKGSEKLEAPPTALDYHQATSLSAEATGLHTPLANPGGPRGDSASDQAAFASGTGAGTQAIYDSPTSAVRGGGDLAPVTDAHLATINQGFNDTAALYGGMAGVPTASIDASTGAPAPELIATTGAAGGHGAGPSDVVAAPGTSGGTGAAGPSDVVAAPGATGADYSLGSASIAPLRAENIPTGGDSAPAASHPATPGGETALNTAQSRSGSPEEIAQPRSADDLDFSNLRFHSDGGTLTQVDANFKNLDVQDEAPGRVTFRGLAVDGLGDAADVAHGSPKIQMIFNEIGISVFDQVPKLDSIDANPLSNNELIQSFVQDGRQSMKGYDRKTYMEDDLLQDADDCRMRATQNPDESERTNARLELKDICKQSDKPYAQVIETRRAELEQFINKFNDRFNDTHTNEAGLPHIKIVADESMDANVNASYANGKIFVKGSDLLAARQVEKLSSFYHENTHNRQDSLIICNLVDRYERENNTKVSQPPSSEDLKGIQASYEQSTLMELSPEHLNAVLSVRNGHELDQQDVAEAERFARAIHDLQTNHQKTNPDKSYRTYISRDHETEAHIIGSKVEAESETQSDQASRALTLKFFEGYQGTLDPSSGSTGNTIRMAEFTSNPATSNPTSAGGDINVTEVGHSPAGADQ